MTGAHPPQQKVGVDKSDALARSMRALSSSVLFGDEEAALLGQPLIHATGGLSGLGAKQLSENDRFTCMVKYLLNYDVFKQVYDLAIVGDAPTADDDDAIHSFRLSRVWELQRILKADCRRTDTLVQYVL